MGTAIVKFCTRNLKRHCGRTCPGFIREAAICSIEAQVSGLEKDKIYNPNRQIPDQVRDDVECVNNIDPFKAPALK
jgi:hypothetical protein